MTSPGIIEYKNVPDLKILGENDILLRIKNIGICGSDIHVYHGKHPATTYPVVQGHEFSAIVEKVGSNVKSISPGMKATARPQIVCGVCGPCKRGEYNVCKNLKVQGFQSDGVAQDLFIVPEERVVKLPDEMGFEEGAMIEPTAVGAHATNRVSSLKGKNVVVSGAGTIGNLVAQFARARGADKILITDISDYRLNIAKKCGFSGLLNVNKRSFEKKVKSYFGDKGFNVGFEAAGVQQSLEVLMKYIEKGSEIVILGVYAENPRVNMYYLGEHELRLYGSMMYLHEDYIEALKAISSENINLNPLITKRFPFEKYIEAYKFIEKQGDWYMKIIIEM